MTDSRAHRQALVDKLRDGGQLRSPGIAAAFEAVPRELFVPGIALDEVYRSSEAILVKSVDGIRVSSASAPDVMAAMLELLDVQPGQRILEIGAGTGYNAALLAYLVGETGRVLSIDIDADLVEGARAHLDEAGFGGIVDVIQADGALGYASQAPYDRVVLTVASRDLAPAWGEQLTADGRLLLPLSIRGPQRCVVFQPAGDHLASRGVSNCSFIALRGVLAMEPQRLPLDALGAITIGVPDEIPPVSPEAVLRLLQAATSRWPSGIEATADEVRRGLQLWVAAHDRAICSLWAEASSRLLSDLYGQGDRLRGTFGLLDADGLAVLGWRDAAEHGGELWVLASPASSATAQRLVQHVRTWANHARPSDAAVSIRAYPRATAPRIDPGEVVLEQRWHHFVLGWG